MLARLEAENLLDDNSAVKNLGLIMALYIKLASVFRDGSLLEEDAEEVCTEPSRYTWIPDRFDDYINAYAAKFGITLRCLDDIDEMTAKLNTGVSLPASGGNWEWSKAFKSYQEEYPGEAARIGGDSLDITTWTAGERKEKSFDRKDPLSAALLKNIKKGMVMNLG